MVNKISKSSKSKYQQAGNSKIYYIGIGVVLAVIALVVVLMSGNSSVQALAGPAPNGKNCPENVAYLQAGVNKYKEVTGSFPAELKELATTKDGKGPFVERLPECPSGNVYLLENGVVKEGTR